MNNYVNNPRPGDKLMITLTDEQINALPEGSELDAMISEILGVPAIITWHILNADEGSSFGEFETRMKADKFLDDTLRDYPDGLLKNGHVGRWLHYPPYSSNWEKAMAVQDEMHKRGFWMYLRSSFGADGTQHHDGWWCGFTPHLTTGWNGRPDNATNAETGPLAICRAALKAINAPDK